MNPVSHTPDDFVELLSARATAHPQRIALRLLGDGENVTTSWDYLRVHQGAAAVAAELQSRIAPGERALLLYPTGLEYVAAFLGCLYAGVVAVPAYPPESNQMHHLKRLLGIVRDARPRFVLTQGALVPALRAAQKLIPDLASVEILATDAIDLDLHSSWRKPELDASSVAFLQYTSGSTAVPKGVVVGHDNLLANERVIQRAFSTTDDDVVLSWLPLFHDMGLIGGLLQPLFSGASLVLMAPQHFIERPLRWLEAISRHGATVSGAPDFAYRICTERAKTRRFENLDLSGWRLAFSGAEPVRAETLHAFAEQFAAAGFDRSALYACYGLAEATLFVSGGQRGTGMRTASFEPSGLAENGAVPLRKGRTLVGCGNVQDGHRLLIVDLESGEALASGRVGEICVSGPSVTRGYWQNDEATQQAFATHAGERFLRTGDLGFLHDNQLFVTGRHKDLIIVRGHNLYPQDVESSIEEHVEVVRKGRVAAFAVELDDGEGIGVAVELGRRVQRLVQPEAVCRAIAEVVAERHGEPASVVLLLNPGALPVTSSGKLQRGACRKAWQQKTLDIFAEYERGQMLGAHAPAAPAGADASSLASESLSDTERRIAVIWQEVLGAPRVGAEDTFFALGGSSLQAGQMLVRVLNELGVSLELRRLFQASSLRAFAAEVERARHERQSSGLTGVSSPQLVGVARPACLPLSYGEQRLWFLWQLEPASTGYTIVGVARISGELEQARVERVFARLIARHESLRTRFGHEQGVAYRVVDDATPFALKCIVLDAPDDDSDAAEVRARSYVEAEAHEPFDLEHGPLLRVTLLGVAPGRWQLIVAIHHIVSDGWSMQLMVDEFLALYAADVEGRDLKLPALPVQYADYAVWQRNTLDAGSLESDLEYWRSALGSELPVLELPGDRSRSSAMSHDGSQLSFAIEPKLLSRLRELAHASKTTLFTLLLASFQLLLHKYTGRRELAVGVPVANRNQAELANLIGFFVNTLVFKQEVDPRATFQELLGGLHDRALSAQAHGNLPFERLVEALNPERSLSHNPLFQVMYNHQVQRTPARREVSGLVLEGVERPVLSTQFDLALDTIEVDDRLYATFTYSTDLFEKSTIDRMAAHWHALLELIARDPSRRIAELSPLCRDERARTLFEWNDTRVVWDDTLCLHELVERQARRTPNALAVVCEGATLSYRELEARAAQLAGELCSFGVRPDVLVGVCAERSLELVVSLLGILKAGGAYLPLDPEYPSERLRYMIADARVSLVVAQRKWADRLPCDRVNVRWLDDEPNELPRALADRAPTATAVRPEHLAYCIYTSGSTGKPKGVAIPHAGVCNRLLWMQRAYQLDANDRVLQKTPFSFDVSVWEFFWPLIAGATLVVLRPGAHRDPVELRAVIEREHVTTLHFVPSMLQAFLASGEWPRDSSLRQVICSGEALPLELAARFARASGATLHNLYGPTEASIDVSFWQCVDEPGRATIPIGRPIANTTLYVLDGDMSPGPIGVVGELYIGGVGLARGYLERPELTAERFVPDPFAPQPGRRLYRSGDLARYRADAAIEYVGRIDQQVKIRGNRVELGEIEAALREQAPVEDAAVLINEAAPGIPRLVAYVALGRAPDAATDDALRSQLRSALSAALPDYMVPALFVFLSALPVTTNGKLDRAALPAPDLGASTREYVAPRGATECQLARIWSEVLRNDRVSARDNFFELGGDSIMALQIVAKAKRAGLALAPKDLFQHQTLEALARAARPVASVPAAETEATGEVPLTPIQRWFFERHFCNPHHWNQALLLELEQHVEASLVERALAEVVAHHDALRLRFARTGHDTRQWYTEDRHAPLEHLDLRGVADVDKNIERAANELHASLDLEHGPLFRCVRFELGADSSARLLWVIHHLVVDGVSWRILLEDLDLALRQLSAGMRIELPPKSASFGTWARVLEGYRTSGAFANELAFWQSVEAAAPEAGGDAADGQAPDTRVLQATLDVTETRALLTEAGQAYRTRINELLLTALAETLCAASAEDSVVVELEGHGRTDPYHRVDVSRTVGWFTTRFPVRLRPDPRDQGRSIRGIKEQLRAVPHFGLGYGLVGPGGSRRRLMFNYLGQLDQALPASGWLRLAAEKSGDARTPFDALSDRIELSARVQNGQLLLDWRFDARVDSETEIRQLCFDYVRRLRALIEHCCDEQNGGLSPSDFPLAALTDDELVRLTARARNVEDVFPLSPLQQGLLLHTLLEPGSGMYLMQDQYRFESLIDPERFAAAWQRVVERHAQLRAAFSWHLDGRMLQVIERTTPAPVSTLDWRDLSEAEQEQRLERMLAQELAEGFDLSRPPLFRVRLIRLAKRRFHCVQSYHHILIDAWCRSLLWLDFFAFYGEESESGHRLPKPREYRDFIAWLQLQDTESTRSYWRQTLRGLTATTPLGVARMGSGPGSASESNIVDRALTLSRDQTALVGRVARERQLTVNTFAQGAWGLLLSQYAGTSDVVMGVTVAGRPAELVGVEDTVGLFINSIPLRLRVPHPGEGISVARWLSDLLAQNAAMRQHEHLPLVDIQGVSEVPRGQPLFESLFVFENAPLDQKVLGYQTQFDVEFRATRTHTNYPVTIVVVPGERLTLQLSYDTCRLTTAYAERMLEHFSRLLLCMAQTPDLRPDQLPLLGKQELAQLDHLNATERRYPFERGYLGLFEAEVARAPERVAVACGEQTLTLAELDARAERVGRALRGHGVRPDQAVATLCERGPWLIVAILGIFKAGAAYLPLDAEHPAARNAKSYDRAASSS